MRSFRFVRLLAAFSLVAVFASSTILPAGTRQANPSNPGAQHTPATSPALFDGPGGCAPIPLC